MELLLFPLIAFAPGIFWLWFFIRRGVFRPGPRRLLLFTFLLGMASTLPAGVLNSVFVDDPTQIRSASLVTIATGMLLVVGPVEELCKFLAVRLLAYRSLYFDEPGDGLVYSAAASLGFASLENLFYVLSYGPLVMVGRAPLSTVAHVVFGSLWGYALGRQVQAGRRQSWQTLVGISAGALVHGIFNVVVFTFWPAAVILVVLGSAWTVGRFTWARRASPFRYRRNYPRIDCPACHRRISIISRYCRFCGVTTASVSRATAVRYWSFCESRNRSDAAFCASCGDQLLR